MKIGVYDLYWSTFGGGEQQAGSIVDALSADHEVHMLGPEAVQLDALRERLGLRLEGVDLRLVENDERAASLVSAEYDLFINHTYRSTLTNLAPRGIYFVMFPHVLDGTSTTRAVARKYGRRWASPVRLLGGVGRVAGAERIVGPVQFQVAPGIRSLELHLEPTAPTHVIVCPVRRGAQPVVHDIGPGARLQIDTEGDDVIVAPAVMGARLMPEKATRLVGVRADGTSVAFDPASVAQRLTPVRFGDFVGSYDMFVANSRYTARWTSQWWGVDSEVLSPPVQLRAAGRKEQLIVSVGRFFGAGSGHSKRQLEMVHAFRRLVEGGLDGWRLVLIGGCSPEHREYAMEVRRAAEGLPVEVRLSAPGEFVDASLAAASIYWHAAGLNSDLLEHPDRAEHFGIAPVEAMSAGAVPVLFAAGGPAEVVQHDVNGLLYASIEDLVDQTRALIADPDRLRRLSLAAEQSAKGYSRADNEAGVRRLVQQAVNASGTPT
jgi:glycosyltransferase involved in cell wall biosynthesis